MGVRGGWGAEVDEALGGRHCCCGEVEEGEGEGGEGADGVGGKVEGIVEVGDVGGEVVNEFVEVGGVEEGGIVRGEEEREVGGGGVVVSAILLVGGGGDSGEGLLERDGVGEVRGGGVGIGGRGRE